MPDNLDTASRIESLLFFEGGSLSIKKLVQLLAISEEEVKAGLDVLAQRRAGGGLALIYTDTEASLAIAPEAAETIEKAFEREIGREVGDAGLEVLAVILYRGPSTRSEIDYIRGVNTSSTIRTLTARGLVERIPNPKDAREYLYRATTDLLAHLGIKEGRELPDYAKITSELATFEEQKKSPFDTNHAIDTGDAQPE